MRMPPFLVGGEPPLVALGDCLEPHRFGTFPVGRLPDLAVTLDVVNELYNSAATFISHFSKIGVSDFWGSYLAAVSVSEVAFSLKG
jgi:hypothetical protein